LIDIYIMYHSIIFDLFGSRRSCFHKFTYVHTGHINLEYELINSRICQHNIYNSNYTWSN
jgi:hypothetical protein